MEHVNRSLLLSKVEKLLQKCSHSCYSISCDAFCFYRSPSKWSNYLRMNVQNSITKNNKSLFFILLLLLLIPCGNFFHMHLSYIECAHCSYIVYELSLRFRSNDIWCHLFVAFNSNNHNNHNIEAKSSVASWTFCICFHRIDLIWSHTHAFISNTSPLSRSPSELPRNPPQRRHFQEFAFAFYWIESKKTHIVHFDASIRTHSVRERTAWKCLSPCLQLCTHFRKFYVHFTHSHEWKCISILYTCTLACEC